MQTRRARPAAAASHSLPGHQQQHAFGSSTYTSNYGGGATEVIYASNNAHQQQSTATLHQGRYGTPTNRRYQSPTASSSSARPAFTTSTKKYGPGGAAAAGGGRQTPTRTTSAHNPLPPHLQQFSHIGHTANNNNSSAADGWVATPRGTPRGTRGGGGGGFGGSRSTTPLGASRRSGAGGGVGVGAAGGIEASLYTRSGGRGASPIAGGGFQRNRAASVTTTTALTNISTASSNSITAATQNLEAFVNEVMGVRMQSMHDLRQRLDDLACLQQREEDAFREQMGALLAQSEHVRAANQSVEEHYASLLEKERGERLRAVQLMQRFKAEGSAVMGELKEALALMQDKYQQEVARNAKLTSQLKQLQQSMTNRGGGGLSVGAAVEDGSVFTPTSPNDRQATASNDASNADLETKIATLTSILEEEDAIILELQQRNKQLEAKANEAVRDRDRMAAALGQMNQSTVAVDAEYNALLREIQQRPESPLAGTANAGENDGAVNVNGGGAPANSVSNNASFASSGAAALSSPNATTVKITNSNANAAAAAEHKITLLNQFAASVVFKLKAEQRQRLFTEEQSAKVVEAQERMIKKMEARMKELESIANANQKQQTSYDQQQQQRKPQPSSSLPPSTTIGGGNNVQRSPSARQPTSNKTTANLRNGNEEHRTQMNLQAGEGEKGGVASERTSSERRQRVEAFVAQYSRTTSSSGGRPTLQQTGVMGTKSSAFTMPSGASPSHAASGRGAEGVTASSPSVQSKLEMYRSSPRRSAQQRAAQHQSPAAAAVEGWPPTSSSSKNNLVGDNGEGSNNEDDHDDDKERRRSLDESRDHSLENDLQQRLAAVTADFKESIQAWSSALKDRPVLTAAGGVGVIAMAVDRDDDDDFAPEEAEVVMEDDDREGGDEGRQGARRNINDHDEPDEDDDEAFLPDDGEEGDSVPPPRPAGAPHAPSFVSRTVMADDIDADFATSGDDEAP